MAKKQTSPLKILVLLGFPLMCAIGVALFVLLAVDPDDLAADGKSGSSANLDIGDETASDGTDDGASEGDGRSPQRTPKVNPATAASVSGVVRLYRSKEPVKGLTLQLQPAEGGAYEIQTGADGTFSFAAVAPGAGYELKGELEPYAAISVPSIDLAPQDKHELGTIWLDVPVDLDVIVLSLTGKPIEGATVGVFPTGRGALAAGNEQTGSWRDRRVATLAAEQKPARSGTTDSAGKARVTGLLPGTYRVSATAEGLDTGSRSGVVLAPDARSAPVTILLGVGYTLVGTVTDSEGEPVVEADVVAVRGSAWNPGQDKWMAKTDEKGVYAINGIAGGRVTLYLVRAEKPPIQAGSFGIPDTARFDIRLRPGGTIRGKVVDEEGKPIEDATVRTAIQTTWSPMSTKTDAEGAFAMEDVPAGKLAYFQVEAKGYMPYPDPSAPSQGEGESLRENSEMVREVVLRKGLEAAITVQDDAGKPLEDAAVTLYLASGNSRGFSARTDAKGTAELLGLLPGDYVVGILAEGYIQGNMPSWFRNTLGRGVEALPKDWRLTVSADEPVEATYKLVKGAVVSGKVIDKQNEPVAGARIAVTNARSEFPVFSDAEGKFSVLAVPPSGRATASATLPDQPGGQSEPFLVETGATVDDIEIKLGDGGAVSGTVRARDGQKLRNAFVRYATGKLTSSWQFQRMDRAQKWPVDEEGRFKITGVTIPSDGQITVRADAEGLVPAYDNSVKVAANDETTAVELVLGTALTITGRVESRDGEKVPGAIVSARFSGGRNRFIAGVGGNPMAQTDENGVFVLKGLTEGKYSVWGQAGGFASASRVQTQSGATGVLIIMKPGLTISGIVKDSAGKPVSGMPVSANKTDNTGGGWWWWGGGEAYTGPDGTFELRDLAEGVYRLNVSARWQWGREVNVQDKVVEGIRAGRNDVEIVIEAGKVIEGTAVHKDGSPVKNGWVYARYEGRSSWSNNRYGDLREDGSFRIAGLQPGSYTITVSGSFKSATQKGVGVGTTNVKLEVQPAFSISGRVIDKDGLAITRGLNVRVKKAGSTSWDWVDDLTPGDGVFMILGLEERSYDVRITASGLPPVVITNVTAGTQDLEVSMVQGVSMSGMVVDESNSPVYRARVSATQVNVQPGQTASSKSTRTDKQGQFSMSGLAEGEYTVTVSANGYARSVTERVPGNDTSGKYTLEVGESVSGTVVDAAGDGISRVSVYLKTAGGNVVAQSRSGSDGKFTLSNVPTGGSFTMEIGRWANGSWTSQTKDGRVEAGQTDIRFELR